MRLAVMMFLEYAIWGAWLPLLALYLSDVLRFSGAEIGWIFATPAIACLVAKIHPISAPENRSTSDR